MAGEVVEPQRTFPRAIVISGLSIAAVLPARHDLAAVGAAAQPDLDHLGRQPGHDQGRSAHGMPWLGPPMALLMTLAGLGGVGAWLMGRRGCFSSAAWTGTCRRSSAKTHPKWKTPWFAMPFQAAFSAIFIVAATQGDTVKGAYLKLVNATLIVYFMPYMYMFAAAIGCAPRSAGSPGRFRCRAATAGSRFWNGLGFLTTARGDRPRAHPARRHARTRPVSSSRSSSARSASSAQDSSSTPSPSAAGAAPEARGRLTGR